MKQHKKILGLVSAIVLLVGVVLPALLPQSASAAQITTRSLLLQTGTNGGSFPGGVVNHFFTFTLPSVGNASTGSIRFDYCTLAAGACTAPTGLVTTSAVLGSESGATGFTLDASVDDSPFLTRTAAAITAGTTVTYQLTTITNPTNENETFFVRITTYSGTDGATGLIDSGTVAASTAEPIVLTGTMPESLVFCTGETIGLTVGVPDCATATDGIISFNQLFSPTDTATATSQMAASTNAGFGYSITITGPTLTSGGNTVTALSGAPAASIKGISQFGLNLKANTGASSSPAIGTEVAPAANGTNYRGTAVGDYATVDSFKFTTGAAVANSASNGTDAQIFTASYIVNVPGSQPAGTYTTTLTYICTATF